jgi:hypothetical protein
MPLVDTSVAEAALSAGKMEPLVFERVCDPPPPGMREDRMRTLSAGAPTSGERGHAKLSAARDVRGQGGHCRRDKQAGGPGRSSWRCLEEPPVKQELRHTRPSGTRACPGW